MRRMVPISILATLLTTLWGPAEADPLRGPIRVMRPNGTTFRITPPSADAWWKDHLQAPCVSCRGPMQAALLLHEVETASGTRFSAGPRYLIAPESLQLGWPRAWLFYPSTDQTRAYVVRHGGVGAADKPLRWDVWIPATPRMERMIVGGGSSARPPSDRSPADRELRPSKSTLSWVSVLAVAPAIATWWFYRLPKGGAHVEDV